MRKEIRRKFRLKTAFHVLLLAAGTAVVFLLNTSPKELFLLSEYKAYEQMKAELAKQHSESWEFSKKRMEQPSISHARFKAKMEMSNWTYDPDRAAIEKIFKNAEMIIKTEKDPKKHAGNYHVALNLENEQAFDMDIIYTNSQIGMRVPFLYSKFLYLYSDEYGEFMKKIYPFYKGPETLEFSQVIHRQKGVTDYLRTHYFPFLIDQLKEDNFTLEKRGKYRFRGETMHVKKVTLSLTPKETKILLNRCLERLIKDKKLHSMIGAQMETKEKLSGSAEVHKEASSSGKIEAEIVNGLKQVQKKLQRTTFPRGFSSILFIDKKGRIIDRTMELTVATSSSEQAVWSVHTKHIRYGQGQRVKEFTFQRVLAGGHKERIAVQVASEIKGEKKKQVEDLQISLNREAETVKFKMNSVIGKNKGGRRTIRRSFTFTAPGEKAHRLPDKISGEVKQVQDVSTMKKYSNQRTDVKAAIKDKKYGGAFSFIVEKESKLTDKMKSDLLAKDFTSEANLNKMTDAQIAEVQREISLNIVSLMNRLGLFGGAFGYPFADDPHVEDLYKEDPSAEEVFNSRTAEHGEPIF
ncbi:hypothetical protein ACH0BF_13385 [Pseudobacillus sp. 179-B 2D1 NHS]|uniref:hypothetical protein n=1 Tax=Pseudobacillus sp. 179-B 2D1 NHS TaxID=3374292 RepID=UPI0038796843